MQNNPDQKKQRSTLAMMAKYWATGKAKTRIGESIGMLAAARLHRTFTLHLCHSLKDASDRRLLAVTPLSRLPDFANVLTANQLNHDWQAIDQGNGDLGARMANLFRAQLTATDICSHLIVIGADCPLVDAATIREASGQLSQQDLVLGKAVDGGYYLIGLRGPWLESYNSLFHNMPWGSSRVFQTTMKRAESADLSCHLLCEQEDIDTVNELDRLRAYLKIAGKNNESLARLAVSIEEIVSDASKSR